MCNFQDSNDFKRQIENLRPEIDSRMIYTFPDWVPNFEYTYQTVEFECVFLEITRSISWSSTVASYATSTTFILFQLYRKWKNASFANFIDVTKSVCWNKILNKSYQLFLSIFSMTNWCQYLINSCRQNKNYWNNGGRDRFIELFEQ